MREKELKLILDREKGKEEARRIFYKQIEVIVDLVNYGSNLVVRTYDSSKRKLEDAIVIGVLLKQVVSMLDAVEVLVSHGVIKPASLQTRCAFEASLYIDFILEGDSERKASYYYVANLRNAKLWALRLVKGSDEREAFSHVFKDLEGYMSPFKPELQDEIEKELENIQEVLSQGRFKEINGTYEGTRIKRVDWYKAYGTKNLREIAKKVKRLTEYDVFYPTGSEVMHSASYRDHVRFNEGMMRFEPIRKLEGADSVLRNVITIALKSYRSILEHYRYGELGNFKRKYMQEWRDGYQNITHVSYIAKDDK